MAKYKRKSMELVRALLVGRTEKCSPACPGWDVFLANRGFEVEACDECNTAQPFEARVSDDEVAQLPEAQRKLAGMMAEEGVERAIRDAGHHALMSEADHEIGDLQQLARRLWSMLPAAQRQRFAATWSPWDSDETLPEPEPDVCCGTCGSPRVQYVCWVDALTHEITDDFGSWDQEDTKFCADCDIEGREGNTGLVSREAEPALFKRVRLKWRRQQAKLAAETTEAAPH